MHCSEVTTVGKEGSAASDARVMYHQQIIESVGGPRDGRMALAENMGRAATLAGVQMVCQLGSKGPRSWSVWSVGEDSSAWSVSVGLVVRRARLRGRPHTCMRRAGGPTDVDGAHTHTHSGTDGAPALRRAGAGVPVGGVGGAVAGAAATGGGGGRAAQGGAAWVRADGRPHCNRHFPRQQWQRLDLLT